MKGVLSVYLISAGDHESVQSQLEAASALLPSQNGKANDSLLMVVGEGDEDILPTYMRLQLLYDLAM